MKSKRTGIVSLIYSALVFVFLYAPIAVLIIYSFNASKSRGVWGGFSLKWYASLLRNTDIMNSLWTSIFIAVASSVIATVIGTAAAVGIYSMKKRAAAVFMYVTYLPMLNPDIVTGISLLLLFSFVGIKLGYPSLLLAHITFNIPYVILSVMPKLNQLDPFIYEAAQDLGASPRRAFISAVLPQLAPGIFTGLILAFTMSIDDFVVSFFTTGSGVNTLSITIYTMAKRGIKPEINALSAIMFTVVLILLVIVNLRSTRDIKKQEENGNLPF